MPWARIWERPVLSARWFLPRSSSGLLATPTSGSLMKWLARTALSLSLLLTINEASTALDALRRGARQGARGVKFHPAITKTAINDPDLEGFYSLAEELRMPIVVHTGPHGWFLSKYRPILIDEVAHRHPQLPLVIEHLGGAGLSRETLAVMQNSPNIYGGLATCLTEDAGWFVPTEEIAFMVRKFGADRFIFGSDFPWNKAENTRRALEVLGGLKLPPVDLDLIRSGNMERLVSSVIKS